MSAEIKNHYYEQRIGQIVSQYEKELADNFAHFQQLVADHQREVAELQEQIDSLQAPQADTEAT